MLALVVGACGGSDSGSTSATTALAVGQGDEPLKIEEPAQRVVLRFDTLADDSKEVALWNKLHPTIHVEAQRLPGQDYYAKLRARVKAGNAPDLALVEYQFMPTMQAAGALVDLRRYGAARFARAFPEWVWNQVTRDGAVFGIPQDIAPMGLYYRKDVFDRFGIQVPRTWDDFKTAAAKLHGTDRSYYLADFPPTEVGQWAGLTWQAGARWFSTEGGTWHVSIDDAASRDVAGIWQALIARKLVKTQPGFTNAWIKDLITGHVATWVAPVWAGGYLKGAVAKAAGKWRVAAMPQFEQGSQASGNWGGSAVAVTTTSKHVKEAAEFAIWLDTQKAPIESMIKTNSIMPALSSALSGPAFNAPQPYFGGQKSFDVFKRAADHVDKDFTWGPNMIEVFSAFGDEFNNAVEGKQTLDQALEKVQQRTIDDLKRQGFPTA